MSDITITPEEFPDILTEIIKFNLNENKNKVSDGIKKIAREAKQEVERKSPVNKSRNIKITDSYVAEVDKLLARVGGESQTTTRNRHYKDSWITSITEENGVLTVTVHNKKWQLVHLLELGHLLKDGDQRVYGKVQPYKHVEPVQQHVEEKVNALLEKL